VCLSHHSTAAAACGGFAAECRSGWKYRLTAARRAPSSNDAAARRSAANADSAMLTAKLKKLNTDLFHFITRATLWPCVCLSQIGVLSKRMNESGWFLAWKLASTHPILFYKEIQK